MAKRQQAPRSRSRSPARHPPGGGGFLRGLGLGLAVAVGVYFYHAGPPDWFGGSSGESEDASRPDSPRTSFDFYDLLPKKVVTVDEPALSSSSEEKSQARRSSTPPPPPRRAPVRPPPTPAASTGETSTPPQPQTPSAPSTAPSPVPPNARYGVQAGSFREKDEADRLRGSLILEGMEPRIRTSRAADGTWHRVVLGPYQDRAAAEAARSRLRGARGIDGRIVREEE